MTNYFSFLKDTPAKILFLIFVSNIFYDDPTLYLYKRIVYSLCIYFALWEIIKYYYQSRISMNSFKMPAFYNIYLPLLLAFTIISLSKDFVNPNLKLITLFNNPFSLLSVCPILIFIVGVNTDDIYPIFKVLLFSIITFVLVASLPIFGKLKYYQGYISAYAFVPFFFISNSLKKYQPLAWILLFVGLFFSNLSDYRIIALRILLFMGLYLGFSLCKRFGFLKLLIILTCCFGLYQFLTNLEDILYAFKDIIGVKSFDDDDTRGFLWAEVFSELNGLEYIFGRGFLGTYFSEYFLMILIHYNTLADHYERFSVEVGFLELILKGGFFWYILFITPILYSSIKGIFWHYNNKLVFSISIFLFTELLLMYIENIPYFSFQFSLIFFFAGFAIRQMKKDTDAKRMIAIEPTG
jgi:hypothetical protein